MKLTIGTQVGAYTVFEHLGGGESATYMALGTRSSPTAVRLLSFEDSDALDRFRRTTEYLQTLEHPNLSPAIELVETEVSDAPVQLLAQEFVKGKSLETWVDEKRAVDEEECVSILDAMLDLLEYLHTSDPPVAHNGVSTAHIVVKADEQPVLCGLERSTLALCADDTAADIYALGLVMASLVTRRRASDLEVVDGKLIFADQTSASDELIATISGMVDADLSQRLTSADAVRAFRETVADKPLVFAEGRRSFVGAGADVAGPKTNTRDPMPFVLAIIAAILLAAGLWMKFA